MNINDLKAVSKLSEKLRRLSYSYDEIEKQKAWLEDACERRGLYRIRMSNATKTIMLDDYSRAIEETKHELRNLGVTFDEE